MEVHEISGPVCYPCWCPGVFIVDFDSEQKLRVRATVLPSVMTTNSREYALCSKRSDRRYDVDNMIIKY